MSVTVVNDWRFKPRAKIEKGLAAAAEYADYLTRNNPQVRLSLWLAVREESRRFMQITIFDSHEAYLRERESPRAQALMAELNPEIADSQTTIGTECDVILSTGGMLKPQSLPRKYGSGASA